MLNDRSLVVSLKSVSLETTMWGAENAGPGRGKDQIRTDDRDRNSECSYAR